MQSLCDVAELQVQDLVLEYQPIFDLYRLRIARAEALLRWNHPFLGRLLPARFLPSLLRSSDMQGVTRWVFQRAVAQLARWQSNGHRHMRMCVNLGLEELTDSFPPYALEVLDAHKVSPLDVELELSEQGLLLEEVSAMSVVRRLHASGFRISIDDFGAGSASLRYMLDLPATTLKFDRFFAAGTPSRRHVAVLEHVSKLAKELGYHAIVEGIENEEQLQAAISCGAGYAQGCYLSPPITAALFETRLREAP